MVGPVAVGADPDLEERRLALDDRQVRRRRERPDPAARPDEREPEREVDLPAPARPLAVDEAEPLGGDLRLGHPRPDHAAGMVHRRRGNLVRQSHALDLLRGLARARLDERRGRVDGARERVEPCLRVRRRLADHPVGGLRAERQLEADRSVLAGEGRDQLERANDGRARVVGEIPVDEPHVARPGRARRVVRGRLDAEQRRLALAREDDRVPALHPPEVRQVQDVVRRAGDDRVEPLLTHQGANAIELGVVAGPGHGLILLSCHGSRVGRGRRPPHHERLTGASGRAGSGCSRHPRRGARRRPGLRRRSAPRRPTRTRRPPARSGGTPAGRAPTSATRSVSREARSGRPRG